MVRSKDGRRQRVLVDPRRSELVVRRSEESEKRELLSSDALVEKRYRGCEEMHCS